MVAKRTPHQHEDQLPMGEEIAPNCFFLSPEEGWKLLDAQAQDVLGMSAEEFVGRLQSGDFTEEQREYVWILRMMVPKGYMK